MLNDKRGKRLAIIAAALATALAGPVQAQESVTLEVSASQPEYMALDRAIWDLYEEENPKVTIKLFAINEDTEAAYQARVAGGDPADIRTTVFPNRDSYQTYVNLLGIDYPYWGLLSYDPKTIFAKTYGVENYLPALNVNGGLFFTFIYYADVMKKAGLNPKAEVRTVDDLRAFLEKAKAFVDSDPEIEYVFDTGWHPRAWARWIPEAWALGLGGTKQKLRDLYCGRIAWTDLENNPLVPPFKLMKEFTDKGYFPKQWWTRGWEQEYEASFIGKQSLVTYHGPWMWSKVLAQRPDAELDGFLFPPGPDGVAWQDQTTADRGSALYVANKDDAHYDEAVKAFIWWNSPEIVKLRAEAVGFVPAMDLSSVGGANLTNPQYVKVIKPALAGEFGKITFDASIGGEAAAGPVKRSGTPLVIEDNAVVPELAKYLTGASTLQDLMGYFETRWKTSYEPCK